MSVITISREFGSGSRELGKRLAEKLGYAYYDQEIITSCRYAPDLYKEMRTKMEWDDDLGENLSALWDILWGMPYKGDDFTIIRPLYFQNIPHEQDRIFTEYVDKICSIFQRAQKQGILTVSVKYVDDTADNLV